jgi:hypothetical protein
MSAPMPQATDRRRRWGTGSRRQGRRDRADALARFVEPGRAAFELSLALCALSLVLPWLVVGAIVAAARSWRRGSARAWLALLAAAWCCLLGVVIRQYLGLGIFP